jgi:hypothetical protein
MKTIDSRLKSGIYGSGRGSAFTPNDFLERSVLIKPVAAARIGGPESARAWFLT